MSQTSMHDSLRVHMLQSSTQLHEVFPDCPLRYQSLLFLEMLKKASNGKKY